MVDADRGLSATEVAEREARGQVNVVPRSNTRTVSQIVRSNVFTRFNALLGAMLAVILVVGPFQDALFGFVLIANAGDRHRAGAPREAHARPAERAHRPEGARRARRAGAGGAGRSRGPGRRPGPGARHAGGRGRRRARVRRPGAGRIAPHRRVGGRREDAGRRGDVGVVRRRGRGPHGGDGGRRRRVRGASSRWRRSGSRSPDRSSATASIRSCDGSRSRSCRRPRCCS